MKTIRTYVNPFDRLNPFLYNEQISLKLRSFKENLTEVFNLKTSTDEYDFSFYWQDPELGKILKGDTKEQPELGTIHKGYLNFLDFFENEFKEQLGNTLRECYERIDLASSYKQFIKNELNKVQNCIDQLDRLPIKIFIQKEISIFKKQVGLKTASPVENKFPFQADEKSPEIFAPKFANAGYIQTSDEGNLKNLLQGREINGKINFLKSLSSLSYLINHLYEVTKKLPEGKWEITSRLFLVKGKEITPRQLGGWKMPSDAHDIDQLVKKLVFL